MKKTTISIILGGVVLSVMFFAGCGKSVNGYSNDWLYPSNIETVYVEMFDNESFRRGLEYELTDSLAKRIEAETPYKIVSDRDIADSVLSMERQTGRPLEQQADVVAVVNWKNLKTGQFLIENISVKEAMSYSFWLQQGYDYGSTVAANRLAERIVEKMQTKW
jgi:hypothetical protein